MSKMCVALESDGRRCRKRATHADQYHGDGEIYSYFDGKPTWVHVDLCEQHRVHGEPTARRRKRGSSQADKPRKV